MFKSLRNILRSDKEETPVRYESPYVHYDSERRKFVIDDLEVDRHAICEGRDIWLHIWHDAEAEFQADCTNTAKYQAFYIADAMFQGFDRIHETQYTGENKLKLDSHIPKAVVDFQRIKEGSNAASININHSVIWQTAMLDFRPEPPKDKDRKFNEWTVLECFGAHVMENNKDDTLCKLETRPKFGSLLPDVEVPEPVFIVSGPPPNLL